MRPDDFAPEFPGVLVPIPEGGVAFVPNPIPRRLSLEPRTLKLHGDAEHAIGTLSGMLLREINPYLVANPLLRREALLSSRIEGTETTPQDLVLLEALDNPPVALQSRPEDGREVANYIRAMNYGLDRMKTLPISLRLLREIHGVLLKGVRGNQERPGEFRTLQNFIGRPNAPIANARFVPPPASQMDVVLNDFESYLHEDTDDSLPLLIRLALSHYQFEAIHPFRDGNGRIGRLLIPLMLCSTDRLQKPLVYLSAYFEKHRQAYMDLLLAVSRRGAWTAWVDFFLEAVIASANESRGQAQGLLALRSAYLERFRSARSSALLQKLVERLFESPVISISQTAGLLEVTPAAASSNLQKLVQAGIIQEVTGRKRNQLFLAGEIVNFMNDLEEPAPPLGSRG